MESIFNFLIGSIFIQFIFDIILPILIFIVCWVIIIYVPRICFALEEIKKKI